MTLILITVLLILWELSGRLLNIPEYILPLPLSIMKAFAENFSLLLSHGKYTVIAALSGLLVAVFFSLIISYFMDKFKPIKKTLYPLLVISQTIPIVALAPIMMIWFGLGIAPKVFTVALVCFFPLSINITEGLANTSKDEIELLKVMGGTPAQVFQHIQLPSVLPYFFSGLKISATYCVMGAVIGEWLGGNKGLGVYMIRSMHTYNVSNLFAGIIAVVVLSIVLFKVIELISWVTMPWERKGEEV